MAAGFGCEAQAGYGLDASEREWLNWPGRTVPPRGWFFLSLGMDGATGKRRSSIPCVQETIMMMQPQGAYVEDARAQLPDDAPWSRIARVAWALQRKGEAAEEANWRARH